MSWLLPILLAALAVSVVGEALGTPPWAQFLASVLAGTMVTLAHSHRQ